MLKKIENGCIFSDNFSDISNLWSITPNLDRVVNISNSIILKHGDVDLLMSLKTPKTNKFIFQASIKHEPIDINDICGIVFRDNNSNSIEVQSTYDGTSNYAKYFKIENNGGNFSFYSSLDALSFSNDGTDILNIVNEVGFFVRGAASPTMSDFTLYNVDIYKSNLLKFQSLTSDCIIEICDSSGYNILKPGQINYINNTFEINCANNIFPIKNATIKIYKGGSLLTSYTGDVYGGDVYEYNIKVAFYIDNNSLESSENYSLGEIDTEYKYFYLTIVNTDLIDLINRKIRVVSYSDFYDGDDNVYIGLQDSNGTEEIEFKKELFLPIIPSSSSIVVKIKIENKYYETFYRDTMKFKILLLKEGDISYSDSPYIEDTYVKYYIKPSDGIPDSDLKERYLKQADLEYITNLVNEMANNIKGFSVKEYPSSSRAIDETIFETPSSNNRIMWVLREGVKMTLDEDYIVLDDIHIEFLNSVPKEYTVTILTMDQGTQSGGGGSTSFNVPYIHNQIIQANTWEVIHNLGFQYPHVTIVDQSNEEVEADITYISEDKLIINFLIPFVGKAICRV